MYLLVKFFNPNSLKLGYAAIGGKYYDEVVKIFPEILSLDHVTLTLAIGVCAKKGDGNIPACILRIKSFKRFVRGLKIYYDIQESLDNTSDQVIKLAHRRLVGDEKLQSDSQLPLWCVFDDIQINAIVSLKNKNEIKTKNLQKEQFKSIKEQLKFLKENEEWFKIYNMFKPIDKVSVTNPGIWNDPIYLRYIGNACVKLSEIEEIKEQIKHNSAQRNDFLLQKKKLRYEAELLMKRCLELDPENVKYQSDIADLHYRNVIELISKNNIRDKDPVYELEETIKYLNMALKPDTNRVEDLYKKGYLLAIVYPELINYPVSQSGVNKDEVKRKISEGIKALQDVTEIRLGLHHRNQKFQEFKKAHIKEFVNSLYYLGIAYDNIVVCDWSIVDYYFGLYKHGECCIEEDDMDNEENSLKYFVECWNIESETTCIPGVELHTCIGNDWIINGVNKLYNLGKANMKLSLIYTSSGMSGEAKKCLKDAEKFLTEALKAEWIPENETMTRDHIAERLACVLIIQGLYESALAVIERFCGKKRIRGYIANTYCLALLLAGRVEEAVYILDRTIRDISNKHILTAIFLISMAYMEKGDLFIARNYLEKALKSKQCKSSTSRDILFLGIASIEMKSGKPKAAVLYYKKVLNSNKYSFYAENRLQEIKRKK